MSNSLSVLLSVYYKESPLFLEKSLESIVSQTRKPEKVIIVKDGTLPESLENVLQFYHQKYESLFQIVGYAENRGLGQALNYGMKFINTTYTARMDTDDIAVISRLEEQMTFLESHPEIDIVGSSIAEFDIDPEKIMRVRNVPELHEMIKAKARLTNPMNHMTVVFKTNQVLKIGGYQHAPYFEDYDLWVRMLASGMKFHNLQRKLVLARVGNDMVGKRHGLQYCQYEVSHFKKIYSCGFISRFEFYKALSLRLPLRIVPKYLLEIFYNRILRKGSHKLSIIVMLCGSVINFC